MSRARVDRPHAFGRERCQPAPLSRPGSRLVLNPSKTQCIIYGNVPDSARPVSVDGVIITPKEKITLLGFTINSKLHPQLYLLRSWQTASYIASMWLAGFRPISSASTRAEDVLKSQGLGQDQDIQGVPNTLGHFQGLPNSTC